MQQVPVGNSPGSVAITPDNKTMLAGNTGDNTVSIIPLGNLSASATVVSVGNLPNYFAISADSSCAFLSNYNSSDISVIDIAGGSVTTTITVGWEPGAIALTPDGSKLFVPCSDGCVYVIDTADLGATPVQLQLVNNGACGNLRITPDGKYALVLTTSGTATIRVSDLSVQQSALEATGTDLALADAAGSDYYYAFTANSDNTASLLAWGPDGSTQSGG
jgi:YVTN family beta-propeller protein